jgi:hypothetical protein
MEIREELEGKPWREGEMESHVPFLKDVGNHCWNHTF